MRRLQFANGKYYHIYNRGVEARDLFVDDEDRVKFLTYVRQFKTSKDKPYLDQKPEPLVSVVAFLLGKNHFHLILRQEHDDGITAMMHPLGTAFSMYFNRKYQRQGRLFEGPFKAKHVVYGPELIALSKYIHRKPIQGGGDTFIRLDEYAWSSYPDYAGLREGTLCELRLVLVMINAKFPKLAYRQLVEEGMDNNEEKLIEPLLFS